MVLSACEERAVRRQLVGVWTYDLAATRQEMIRREASPGEINYMESILGTMQQAELHFQSDGTLLFALEDIQQTGSWSLREGGQELVVNLTGADQVSDIEYLLADTLILSPRQIDNASFPRVLIAQNNQ